MTSPLPGVDVVVTVIHHGDKILLVFNPQWGAFTLPMTKLRQWPYGEKPAPARTEAAEDAAMRNVGECLGKSFTHGPTVLRPDIVELEQSDADSRAKRYQYRVFGFSVTNTDVAPGIIGEWLTVDEILNAKRHPISPTARSILGKLQGDAALLGRQFP